MAKEMTPFDTRAREIAERWMGEDSFGIALDKEDMLEFAHQLEVEFRAVDEAAYRRGVEAAAQVCLERARELRDEMPGKPAAVTNSVALAQRIRALLPERQGGGS